MFQKMLLSGSFRGAIKDYSLVLRVYHKSSFSSVTEEVRHAIQTGQPVVALESTILTHGLPADKALSIGRAIENVVRSNGAIPATIAICNHQLHIGMSDAEFEHFIEASKSGRARKAALRDLPYALTAEEARHLVFGTTVSATAFAAHQAGIKVFATGGIGGVHREGEKTLDISSDLTALATIPVAVVSAGVKSILDIPRTLEVLESKCVVVASVGTDEFPAFFTRKSGIRSPCNINTPKDAAELFSMSLKLRPSCGLLIAVPIPDEMQAVGENINNAIERALGEAKKANICGASVTPFILERTRELTNNASLQANIKLILNNAKFAAEMAVSLSHQSSQNKQDNINPQIVVFGGTNLDTVIKMNPNKIKTTENIYPPASYPGTVEIVGGGGVGRNVAEVLARLSVPHIFFTALGEDTAAEIIREQAPKINWKLAPRLTSACRTANYTGILNADGELLFGVADMDLHSMISADFVKAELCKLDEGVIKLICIDGNIQISTIQEILDAAENTHTPVWFEPTDLHKCTKISAILKNRPRRPIAMISPNISELKAIHQDVTGKHLDMEITSDTNQAEVARILEATIKSDLLGIAENWFVKLGRHGVIFVNNEESYKFSSPISNPNELVSVSGAGDSCAGAMIYLHYLLGWSWKMAVFGGLRAAELSLTSKNTVSPELSSEIFDEREIEKWCKIITVSEI